MPPALISDFNQIDFSLPGKHHYQLAFPLDSAWGCSLVPMTVINGTASGTSTPPGVAAFGGTHGNEYEGQLALKRLCFDLEASDMRGRLILLPQLSESACRAHTRRSPEDGVNMNRAFPGASRGTLSYRIADFVTSRIFPQVQVVMDLHAGGTEAVFPLCTSLHPLPDPRRFEESLIVAKLFDTPFVFVYSRQMASGLLSDQAEDEGKVVIGGEFGNAEAASVEGVAHAYEGIRNVLRHYKLLPGEVVKIAAHRASRPRVVAAPALADYVPCPCDAIWEPVVKPGADVTSGQLLGRLHDFSDHSLAPREIRAHKAGVVIAMFFAANCKKGLTLYVIAEDLATAL